jgi:transcriptional regulator with XRE-family HTH domain
MNKEELMALLREKITQAGDQRKLAAQLGVSQPHLSEILNGRKEPAEKVLTALGLRRVVMFEKIEKGG